MPAADADDDGKRRAMPLWYTRLVDILLDGLGYALDGLDRVARCVGAGGGPVAALHGVRRRRA